MHQHQQHPMLDRQGDLPENEGPDDLKEAETVCASVETVGQIGSPHAMPDETELLLIICRGLKIPLVDFWPRFKNYS